MVREIVYTKEALIEPLAYVMANTELARKANEVGAFIFSGSDVDVLIYSAQDTTAEEPPLSKWIDTTVALGPLYREGYGSTGRINGGAVDLYWYPSPTQANGLIEKLGLRLGEDVFRFVHDPKYDELPPRPYVEHFARGEYPTSTGSRFTHDRDDDHAPGIILMPPGITANIRQLCQDMLGNPRANNKYRRNNRRDTTRIGNLTGGIDGMTSYLGRFAKLDLTNEPNADAVSRLNNDRGNVHAGLWQDERQRQEKIKGRKVTLSSIALEHILELRPAILALQT